MPVHSRLLFSHVARLLTALVVVACAASGGASAALASGPSGGAGLAGSGSGPTTVSSGPSGGAGLGGLDPTTTHRPRVVSPPSRHARGAWMRGFTVTEYWPAPEAWFTGVLVSAPGLPGKHRVDWLYSAQGVSMEGEGLGLDGQIYHIASLGNGGWVTAKGKPTSPTNGWAAGVPFWRAGGFWKDALGAVTFPLEAGGWFAGRPRKYLPLRGVTFAAGPSLPLTFYGSIAVDPKVIPLGSRVYVPAYRHDGHGGWFIAQDTGGGILRHHIDVYRPPPASAQDGGQYLTGQRILVIRPGR